jgi:hypothetical protein
MPHYRALIRCPPNVGKAISPIADAQRQCHAGLFTAKAVACLAAWTPALHMRKTLILSAVLALADFEQRASIEFDHCEVLKKRYVVGLAFHALKLLAGQRGAVLDREFINRISNDHTNMFQLHFVNTPMYWRYQLNHTSFNFGAQSQWLVKLHDRNWASIPDIFYVGRAMPLNFVSFPKVLFVGPCPVGEVANLTSRDIYFKIVETRVLKREERLIISDDVFHRHESFLRLDESSRAVRHLGFDVCDLVTGLFKSILLINSVSQQ